MAMNAQDLCAIQECLTAYKKLLDFIPTIDELDLELKTNRIDIIRHLMNVCGTELNRLSEEYRNE
jgi:hypothetical protein